MILEWNKSCIELIAIYYVHPENSTGNHLPSHLRAKMVLDHSRLGLENKSGRIFCVRQVYFTKPSQQICSLCMAHLRWKSTMRRCFYHTDLRQNAVFYNFSGQMALIQFSNHRSTRELLAKPLKKFQNHLYGQPVLTFDKISAKFAVHLSS